MLGTATGRNGLLWCSLMNPRNYPLSFSMPGLHPLLNLCQPIMALIDRSKSLIGRQKFMSSFHSPFQLPCVPAHLLLHRRGHKQTLKVNISSSCQQDEGCFQSWTPQSQTEWTWASPLKSQNRREAREVVSSVVSQGWEMEG